MHSVSGVMCLRCQGTCNRAKGLESCWHCLKTTSPSQPSPTPSTAITPVQATGIAYLDFCHGLLAGLLADAFALLFLESPSMAKVSLLKTTSEHGMSLLTISSEFHGTQWPYHYVQ